MSYYIGSKIVKDGLVFGYDADDRSSRFYKGEPTTNLYISPTTPGLYFDNAYDGEYGFGDATNSQWVIDNSDQPITGENVQKVSRIASGVSQRLYLSWGGIMEIAGVSFAPNEVKTFSYYYYGTFGTTITQYMGGTDFTLSSVDASSGNGTTNITIPVPTYEWKRIQVQITNLSSSFNTWSYGWIILHSDAIVTTLNNTEYWKFTGIQVESKTHATQNVGLGGTRSVTSSLIDLKRESTIDLTRMSYDTSSHPYFDGINNRIVIGDVDLLGGKSEATWEAFIKPGQYGTTGNEWRSIATTWNDPEVGLGHTWYFDIYRRTYTFALRTDDIDYYPEDIYGNINDILFPDNELTHYVVTYNSNNKQIKVYINGKLELEATKPTGGNIAHKNSNEIFQVGVDRVATAPMNGNIPVVRIYDRELSSNEILQNYNAQKRKF